MPTRATLVNRLIAEGTIERVRVNRYRVNPTLRSERLEVDRSRLITLDEVHRIFMRQDSLSESDWEFRRIPQSAFTAEPARPQPRPEPPVLRRIQRDSYHSHGNGAFRTGIEGALNRIALDSDGVRRSFGLEWEIYALTPQQEDKLARLLDTLPAHFTERDGSLSGTGVEIIFLPLGRSDIIRVFHTLQNFCRENNVQMQGTGAHITYGVNNARVTRENLQIRLNRIALAVKAASTQPSIKRVFGRDFTGYAELPQGTAPHYSHSLAWSASRGTSAYELRLCNWSGDIQLMTEMMVKTEFVFHRTFTAQDFLNIFRIMGADTSEA